MTSRIEQIIEEIEEYIDGCSYQPFSKKNIVVDKEEIEGVKKTALSSVH